MLNEVIYYRITYDDEGIYNAFKRNVSVEVWKDFLSSDKVKWLPKPPSYASFNKSYFTEYGYKKFNKYVLPLIINYLDAERIVVEKVYGLKKVIYSDKYQVIVEKGT